MAAILSSGDAGAFRVRRSPGPRIAGGIALVALAWGIWWAAHQQATVARKAAEDSVLIPVVPPPPPPPPPQVKPPEPKPDEVPPPQNQPAPQPTPPEPTPSPAAPTPSAGQAVSIDGAAQAGGDAFSIGAGSGGGMRGGGAIGSGLGGFNRAAYATYLEGELRRALEGEKGLRMAVLRAHARVWINAAGKISRVDVADTEKASDIQAALVGRAVRPPDPGLQMPVALSLDFRRSG